MKRLELVLLLLFVHSCGAAELGRVSWYGEECKGKRTASGEPFDPEKLTCASNTHKLGATLRVTNPRTKEFVIVRVTDRGPALWTKRILDLSRRAFSQIANLDDGERWFTVEEVK